MTAVSWLDWKLGARLLLKYPALTIIGGLSLAGAIAIGAVGIEVAGELLYKRLPFDEGSRVVTVGRTARTVVGVMPPRFGFPHNQQVWVPLPVQDAPPREGPAVQVFGRLADGASWQDAAAELDVVSARSAADQPTTHAQLRTRVRAFAGRTPGDPLRLEDLAVHAIVLLLLGAGSA